MIVSFLDQNFKGLQNNASLIVGNENYLLVKKPVELDELSCTCEAFTEDIQPTFLVIKDNIGDGNGNLINVSETYDGTNLINSTISGNVGYNYALYVDRHHYAKKMDVSNCRFIGNTFSQAIISTGVREKFHFINCTVAGNLLLSSNALIHAYAKYVYIDGGNIYGNTIKNTVLIYGDKMVCYILYQKI